MGSGTVSSRGVVSGNALPATISGTGLIVQGNDFTNALLFDTVQISLSVKDRSDTMSFTLRFSYAAGIPAIPRVGQPMYFAVNGKREFSGVIQNISERIVSANIFNYEVQCADWTRWFDRHLVQGAKYPSGDDANATISSGVVVKAIIDTWVNRTGAFFFTYTDASIQAGADIPQQTFDFVTPSSAIDTVARLNQYRWFVDFDGVVYFGAPENVAGEAPISYIDWDTTTLVSDVVISEEADQIVNVAVLKDAKSTQGQQVDVTTTTEGQTFVSLGYEPENVTNTTVVVQPPTGPSTTYSTAGGNLKEENVDGKPGDGQTRNVALVCLTNWGIRFETAPPAGSKVTTTYNYLDIGDSVWLIPEGSSIAEVRAREGTGPLAASDGIYEEVYDAGDMESVSKDAIYARADLYLKSRRHKWSITFRCYGSWSKEWRPGQVLWFVASQRYGGKFAAGKTMHVIDVRKSMVTPTTFVNDITLSSDMYGTL